MCDQKCLWLEISVKISVNFRLKQFHNLRSFSVVQFLSAARNEHADLQVHFVLLPFFLPHKRLKEAFRGQKSTVTWVIEATDFRTEVRSDL